MIKLLNYLHKRHFHFLLNIISNAFYFIRGFGWVSAKYHPRFRAYEYKIEDITYLSMGPGWAYSFPYLKELTLSTYNYFYTPKEGDTVVDIGAGLGEESIVYAQLVGNSGKVYPIEANPKTSAGLLYLFEKNDFENTYPKNFAIYNNNEYIFIEDDEENYLVNTIGTDSKGKNRYQVEAKTLDQFVKENEIPQIDFLKSNIEGAEKFLIEGMGEAVKLVKNICISCHDFRHVYHNHGEFYMTKDKIRIFFENNGFEVRVRNTGNKVTDDYIYGVNKYYKKF